jgi:polyferredoxin
MKKISKIQILRYAVLTVFLIIVTVATYRHQLLGGGPGGAASIHTICPFGGLETLYSYIAGGAYLQRTNISNFILLAGTIVLALLRGRVFCGWICMFGWIQEIPARLGKWIFKKRFSVLLVIDKPLRYLKYIVLFAVLYFTWGMAALVISPYDPLAAYAHIPAGFASMVDGYLIGTIILIGSFVLSFFYDRVFCKYLCPMGAFLGIISKISSYKIKRDEETCINCNKCTKACPVNIDVAKLKSVTDAECINCLECVTVCPTKKETLKPFELGKYIKPLIVGIAGVIIYVGIIEGTDLAGIWKTQENNLAAVVTKQGALDPYSIRGFMTMEEIAKTFNIDIKVLYKELDLSLEKIPATTKMKEVKNIDKRIGENSVRDAVAKITGFVKGQPSVQTDSTKASTVQDKEKSVEVAHAVKQKLPGTKETTPAVKTSAVGPGAVPAAPSAQKTPAYTEEMVKAQFEGKGVGEKTLAQVAKENNIDMGYIKERLSAKGFTMKETETVKEIAARYNTTPIEFMKMLLVEGPSGSK